MTLHRTHSALRLGDNLAALHFLRKLAAVNPEHTFRHYAHLQYIHQLAEVVCDLPNLQVLSLESVAHPSDHAGDYWAMRPVFADSIDTWKNADGLFYQHMERNAQSYGEFHVEHFRELAKRMGLESPIIEPRDLLFDYPALAAESFPQFDMLIVNSQPMSGQLPLFNPKELENLIGELAQRHSCVTTAPTRFNVPCTAGRCMTVTRIGALSRFCKYIVGVATGPLWPTLNTFNQTSVEFRLMLLEPERITICPHTEHAVSAEKARRVLQLQGLL